MSAPASAQRPISKAAAAKLLASIPVYDETTDSFERSYDWPDCFYRAEAAVTGELSWEVAHELRGAPGIAGLLASGNAAWAVEHRCADTMTLGLDRDTACNTTPTGLTGRTRTKIQPDQVGDNFVYLWPGIVTVKDCHLDPVGTAWGSDPIPLPPGRWLARGAPIRGEHKRSSPLRFLKDDTLTDGEVSIKASSDGGDTRFLIWAHSDRLDRLWEDRGALLGCWATALAMLPYQEAYTIECQGNIPTVPGSRLGSSILDTLTAHNEGLAAVGKPAVPLWDNKDDWDPMLAATVLLPLPPPEREMEED